MNREEFKMVIIALVLTNESSKDMTRTDFRDALDELIEYIETKADEVRHSIKKEEPASSFNSLTGDEYEEEEDTTGIGAPY